MKRIRQH